jgi:hypothetical protein
MPSWHDIQGYARNKYRLFKDEPDKFAIVFKERGDRTQLIWVRPFKAYNQDFLEFKSFFCKEGEMPPAVALRKNAEMALGFIACVGDYYAVIWNVAMNNMVVEEFEMPLQIVSSRADELEQLYSSGKDTF